MSNTLNILVAEDDIRIQRLLSDFLKQEKYNVITANDGEEALERFKNEDISLVILDVMMPIYDGWHVCKEIRKNSNVPILILTAKDSDLDELFGFDIGADEYISKPFNPMLLIARVKNLLKRSDINETNDKKQNLLTYHDIILNLDSKNIVIGNEIIELKAKEYDLIYLFMKNKERVFDRDKLLDIIWGYDYEGDPRTVDTHINRLRKKLGQKSNMLKTIRGLGYKFGG